MRVSVVFKVCLVLLIFSIRFTEIECKKKKKSTTSKGQELEAENEIKYETEEELQEKLESLKQSKLKEMKQNSFNELTPAQLRELKVEEIELRKKVDRAAKKYGEKSIEKAEALHKYGRNIYKQQRYRDSYSISKEILSIYEHIYGPEHVDTANALGNLGVVAYRLGIKDECEVAMKRAIYILIQEYGFDSKEVLLHRGKMMQYHIPDGETTMGYSYDDYLDNLEEL